MKKENHVFSKEETDKLRTYRDARLKTRVAAPLLLSEGVPVSTAAFATGKSPKTIELWREKYSSEGIESLNSFQYKPKQSLLTPEQIGEVVRFVKENNPSATKEVARYIKDRFQVEYCGETVRNMLKKNGLAFPKPKTVPGGGPDEETQKKFVDEYFAVKSSSDAGTVFLFVDGMRPLHRTVPGRCRGDPRDPPVLPTNSGRARLNVLGAYNPDTRGFTHSTGEANCDARRAISFFELLLETCPKASEIVVFLDNAKYFKAAVVEARLAEHPALRLEFLPTYSPNLNLIERFWRFAKKRLVGNKYYKEYKTFRAGVFRFLNNVDRDEEDLKSLMVEKFQIVSPAKNMPKYT